MVGDRWVPSWLRPPRKGKLRRLHHVPMRLHFRASAPASQLAWNWHWVTCYGAKVAHAISQPALRRAFGVVLAIVGLRMLSTLF